MMQLHLRLRPRQRHRALEGGRVVMLVGQVEHFGARRRDQRPERDARRGSRRDPHAAAKTEDRIEHGADRIGKRPAVDHRNRRRGCRARGREIARGRSRIAARRRARLRPPPGAPPRPAARSASAAGAWPEARRPRRRTPSARTAWRRPDARRRRPAVASTTSAYEVSSISRARLPRFVIDTRRTSASSSGETATSSVVVMVPSRRTISARSSENSTS